MRRVDRTVLVSLALAACHPRPATHGTTEPARPTQPLQPAQSAPRVSGDSVPAGAETTMRRQHTYVIAGSGLALTPRSIMDQTVAGRGHMGSVQIAVTENGREATLSFDTPDHRTNTWNGWEIEVSVIDGYQDAVTLTVRRVAAH